MKTFTTQQSFNFLLNNQDRLGDKISLLADLWGASRLTVSGIKKEITTTSRKTVKTAIKAVKTRHRCKVAKKAARATTVIFKHTVAAVKAAAAVSLLRSLGRKSEPSLAYGEVMNLSVEALAYASKEEAVNSAWSAFKAAVLAA